MKRGPKPTTMRGRAAGGVELRTWVSAAEMDRVRARADAAGMTVPDYVRACALGEVPA